MTQKQKDKIEKQFTDQNELYLIIGKFLYILSIDNFSLFFDIAYLLRKNIITENFYYYYLILPLK